MVTHQPNGWRMLSNRARCTDAYLLKDTESDTWCTIFLCQPQTFSRGIDNVFSYSLHRKPRKYSNELKTIENRAMNWLNTLICLKAFVFPCNTTLGYTDRQKNGYTDRRSDRYSISTTWILNIIPIIYHLRDQDLKNLQFQRSYHFRRRCGLYTSLDIIFVRGIYLIVYLCN